MVAGKKLGSGISRKVYDFLPNPKWVIKFEDSKRWFQNVIEWEVWNYVMSEKQLSRWFAPCISISNYGTILVQRRVSPLTKERAPLEMPDFFGDFQLNNYGILEGRVVACDYGLSPVLLTTHGTPKLKTVPQWVADDDDE